MGIEGEEGHDTPSAESIGKTVKADSQDISVLKNSAKGNLGGLLFLWNTACPWKIDEYEHEGDQTESPHDKKICVHTDKIFGYTTENGARPEAKEEGNGEEPHVAPFFLGRSNIRYICHGYGNDHC